MTERMALITGVTGQDGAYLAEPLFAKAYIIDGINRRSSSFNTGRVEHLAAGRGGRLRAGNRRDPAAPRICRERVRAHGPPHRLDGRGGRREGIDAGTGRLLVEADPCYFRSTEVDLLIGDPSKAREKLGWRHRVIFDLRATRWPRFTSGSP